MNKGDKVIFKGKEYDVLSVMNGVAIVKAERGGAMAVSVADLEEKKPEKKPSTKKKA